MSELEYCAFCDGGYAHSGICDRCTTEIGQMGKELADKDRQLAERTRQRDAYKKALEMAEDELMTARADAEHWKSQCNAMQRMVHESRADIARKDGLIEQMREALEYTKENAVCLSEYYLGAFGDYKDNDEIQGWPKIKWIRALKSYEKVKAALAAERGE